MNRRQLQDSITAAQTFIDSARAAVKALDRQRDDLAQQYAHHGDHEASDNTAKRKPYDSVNGCKESGQCKRDSLDLTRRLAELRKP